LKLKGAETTVFEARRALAQLHLLPNKNNTGKNYTNSFFQAQWDEEQEYHAEAYRSTTKKQEKELGRLLRLEDQLEAEWYVLQHFNSPAFTFSHSDHFLSSHQVCGLIIDHPGSSPCSNLFKLVHSDSEPKGKGWRRHGPPQLNL
jgi:hypothetical protein